MMETADKNLRIVRANIVVIVAGLALSGITAFPIEKELRWLINNFAATDSATSAWLVRVYEAVRATNGQYPFLSYGTDWLAFAHLMLAVLFAGIIKDPVKNSWVIRFGIIACAMIVPLAFIAGSIRGIPIFWRLIDCAFGVFCMIPLYICYRGIKKLEEGRRNAVAV